MQLSAQKQFIQIHAFMEWEETDEKSNAKWFH